MSKKKNQCYFVKQKDGELLKFSYGDQQNVYYQILLQERWSEKKSIYKECFEYFYVLIDGKGRIHIFCQDICGDIILCTLEETKWTVKIVLKFNIIMPRYIGAFIDTEDIHLFYHIVDKHTHGDVLVHQRTKEGTKWSSPKVVSRVDHCCQFPYSISQDCNDNIVLVNTIFSQGYQLTSRTFYTIEGQWGKEEIIHTSILPYRDFTSCVEESRKHYLFITQHEHIHRLIYQCKEVGLQNDHILFQHKKIDSCLFVLTHEELLVLWICEDKLYGSQSTDHGQNFSPPKIVDQFDKNVPRKGFYQQWEANKQNKCTLPHVIYVMNQNEEDHVYLQGKCKGYQVIEADDQDSLIDMVDDPKTDKLQLREKGSLQRKLKNIDEELEKLNEAINEAINEVIEVEQKEQSKLQNQLYKEKEKNKLSTSHNNLIKEKNSYLEHELLRKDNEKISIQKQLAELTKENEELQQKIKQVDVMKDQNLNSTQTTTIKSMDDGPKPTILSLARWFFEDENM